MDTQAAGTQFAEQSHQQTIDLQAGIIANQQHEIDRLNILAIDNAEEKAKLKATLEWYQGQAGKRMGAAAQAEIAGTPTDADEIALLKRQIHNLKRHIEDYCPAAPAIPTVDRNAVLELLANHGGSIVSTASLDSVQIAAARIEKRMYVREDNCGFVWLPPTAPTKRERELDAALDDVIGQRDTYHDWADKLADGIAKHLGVEVGEHSNQNCPWAEALEAISQPATAEQSSMPGVAQPTAQVAVSGRQAIQALRSAMDQAGVTGDIRAHMIGFFSNEWNKAIGKTDNSPMSPSVSEMVNRFLGWKLPHNFSPDNGIEFSRPEHKEFWPIGTNLFTADEAKAMFEYVLATPATVKTAEGE
jgi:hypothetical protein